VEVDFRGLSKFKEGQKMPLTSTLESKRDELVQAARLLGENLSRRAFGEAGPDLNVTLTDLEQFLRPLVEALAAGFLAEAAGEQTQRLPETLPCPTCGRESPRSDHGRTLVAEQGPFTWVEPVCHCEHCQRSFFPSTDSAEN
jgi:NADH pyrophosphatase NudC (nudix superfamily)